MKQTTLNLTEEKERKYYSETDFLRVEVRKLSEELEIDVKSIERLTKKECRKLINEFYRLKVNKEKGLLRKLISYLF
ncbi:hypothetical protein [Fusobacterium ulcerans]|uniref:hypothetical protein n=1 Tax=Fusobacterium ulcerans TaxID=861 RepID=UPI003FEF1BB6